VFIFSDTVILAPGCCNDSSHLDHPVVYNQSVGYQTSLFCAPYALLAKTISRELELTSQKFHSAWLSRLLYSYRRLVVEESTLLASSVRHFGKASSILFGFVSTTDHCYQIWLEFQVCEHRADWIENLGRSSTLRGSTGTAFALGFQNSIGQIGGAIGPQLFRTEWSAHNYRNSFAFCMAAATIGFLSNLWTFYLTRNVEYDILRVHRLRRKANKAGTVLADDDVQVFQERQFFPKGLTWGSPEVRVWVFYVTGLGIIWGYKSSEREREIRRSDMQWRFIPLTSWPTAIGLSMYTVWKAWDWWLPL